VKATDEAEQSVDANQAPASRERERFTETPRSDGKREETRERREREEK
jgi:hypothetical protein